MNRTLTIAAVLGVVGLASCEKKPTVVPPVVVTVAPVVQKDVYEMRTWVGLLDGYQNADIRAQVTGYLMTQDYKEGSFVNKGAILFTIDQRPFQAALAQAQADYATKVAQAQLAQITLDRQSQLFKTKVISQQEYDTSYQDTQAAIAQAAAAQAQVQTAQINLNYCTITAPFDGITGVAQAQIGDLVGPGGTSTVLTQMSQVDPIKVNFWITEQEYLEAADTIREIENRPADQKVSRISLRLADGKEYPEKGSFDFVNRQVNVATGSIQVTALFPNSQSYLRPGLFARVTAPVDFVKGALLVPQEAIVELQGTQMVSVLGPGDIIDIRRVKLGPVEGDLQVITSGIQAGERVVVGGVEKVKAGMKVVVQAAPAATPAPSASPLASPGKNDK